MQYKALMFRNSRNSYFDENISRKYISKKIIKSLSLQICKTSHYIPSSKYCKGFAVNQWTGFYSIAFKIMIISYKSSINIDFDSDLWVTQNIAWLKNDF